MRLGLCVGCGGALRGCGGAGECGGCNKLMGTADGWDKRDALSGAQAALAEAVAEFKKGKGAVTVSAMKAKPQPYWRESVSAELYVKPDVVTAKSYTVCWNGRGIAGRLHLRRQGLLVELELRASFRECRARLRRAPG